MIALRSVFASLWESFKMAMEAIRAHKMRAFLTLLGVVIGVMTIISMMTVLGGIKRNIENKMENGLGANVFQVQRYEGGGGVHIGDHDSRKWRPKIEPQYADAIRQRCPSVREVGVEAWDFGRKVKRGSLESNPNQQIAGGTPEFGPNNSYNVIMGRGVTDLDNNSARNVIVLGYNAYKKLYPGEDPIGEFVRVEGQRYEVIGVFEERGSMFGQSQDNANWIPLNTWLRIYGDHSVNLTVQSWSRTDFEQAQEEVIDVMRTERGLKPGQPNNFTMWTPDMVQQNFNQTTGFVGKAAFGICAISLLVAGIGIMNIMLISVTERTREIGLRKAVGGTKGSILRQFLIEAVMLSEVGGAIGILLGYFIAIGINLSLKVPTPVPIWSVILSIIFCSGVGIGFGMWPAVKAARLDPIEALRYE